MKECALIRNEFSGYLDCAVSGSDMQRITGHLESCPGCAAEYSDWRNSQSLLSLVGPAKAPEDLGLRLRVALSHEAAHTTQASLARWKVRWQNTIRPLVLQASAGLASTILLVGSVSLLIGVVASPPAVLAWDQPLGMATDPHFLYTSLEPGPIGDRDNPVVVEAFINGDGQVYDYKIVSGATDVKTLSQLQDALLFSVFDPARTFGLPVRGTVVLSFSGVSVQG
jgi:hypothetical protein